MKIVVDEVMSVATEQVQEAFLDPEFYAGLGSLGAIAPPELRSLTRSERRATAVVAYRFAGQLNGPARRLLDPGKLSWAQVTEMDLEAHRAEVTMVPDNYANLLSFAGWYELSDAGPGRCRQHLEADLRVHLPLLGPLAERALATSVRDNLAGTARLVETFSERR